MPWQRTGLHLPFADTVSILPVLFVLSPEQSRGGRGQGRGPAGLRPPEQGLRAGSTPGSPEEMWRQVACWEVVDAVDRSLGYLALDPLELSVFRVGDRGQPAIVTCLSVRPEGRPKLWAARWPRTSCGRGGIQVLLIGMPSQGKCPFPSCHLPGRPHFPLPRTVP